MMVLMAAASERWAALCTSTVTNTSAGPRSSRLQKMMFLLIESARQRNLEMMWQRTKKLLLFFSSLSWRLWLVAGSFV